jgi:hypothetical protein
MQMGSCTQVIFNMNKETAWPKFQEALASAGCKEEDILFVWDKIKLKAQDLGEVLLPSRTTPEKSFLGISGALGLVASPRPKSNSEDVVVVWQWHERFVPGQVSVRIFR